MRSNVKYKKMLAKILETLAVSKGQLAELEIKRDLYYAKWEKELQIIPATEEERIQKLRAFDSDMHEIEKDIAVGDAILRVLGSIVKDVKNEDN